MRAVSATGLIRKRSVTIVAALLAVIAGLGAGTASAATTHARPALAAQHRQLDNDAGEQGVCANCAPPLAYTTGNPVMGTTSGSVTITPIYWAPTGYNYTSGDTFSSNYQTIVNKFITDVAAASTTTAGRNSSVFGILPEYSQTVNGVTTNIKDSIKAGTPQSDTDAYPATGQCTPVPNPSSVDPLDANYTACITDAQLQAELSSYITAHNLPTGLDNIYPVFFPGNVQTQLGTGTTAAYSLNAYCGYHSTFKTGGNTVIYANEPFSVYTDCGYNSMPNGDPYADTAVSVLSHEVAEAMTDPVGLTLAASSYRDKAGNEIGDECNGSYAPALGTVPNASYGPMAYDQVINGDNYEIQTEFSNAAYKANGIGKGCIATPYVLNSGPRRGVRHDQAGLATSLTVDPGPSSLPADGSSTSTVTVTATDAAGDPVAGDPINVFTHNDDATAATSDDAAPDSCGTLSNGDGGPGNTLTTNAAGQVSVTYTASTISGNCYILASDPVAGSTDQALIYQGSDQPDAPSITQSTLPSSLVSGGASATFTASAANPADGSNIADARFGVYITGDDNATTGINASQLTLSYKDDGTQGDYVNVPLTGTTINGGQISGLVSPDTAENLNSGATRNATFELTLAGNAADSTTTGDNLQVQIILDQIDPADGSLSNLDMTTPGDVPVTQQPGDTVTYSGKLVTTTPPNGSTPGTATLEAKTCHFTSDNASCRLTGTASYTTSGDTTTGTLTGTITTDPAPGVPDLVIGFTETFTTTSGSGTGTGNGQVIFFDNGNTTSENLSAAYTTSQSKQFPNIQNTQGTLTFTNPTP